MKVKKAKLPKVAKTDTGKTVSTPFTPSQLPPKRAKVLLLHGYTQSMEFSLSIEFGSSRNR
jgi:hypothetical protein